MFLKIKNVYIFDRRIYFIVVFVFVWNEVCIRLLVVILLVRIID